MNVLSIATGLKSHLFVCKFKYGLKRMNAFSIIEAQSYSISLDFYDTFVDFYFSIIIIMYLERPSKYSVSKQMS